MVQYPVLHDASSLYRASMQALLHILYPFHASTGCKLPPCWVLEFQHLIRLVGLAKVDFTVRAIIHWTSHSR